MSSPPEILIACIGNIFLGDDAFGVHVARELKRVRFPKNVHVKDFGIRGIDLAYALIDTCDIAILVDAAPRGDAPGTLYVIEPEIVNTGPNDIGTPDLLEAHSLSPDKVLRLTRALGGGRLQRILIVGCEPTPFDPDAADLEMSQGLSLPVASAVQSAVELIESLVAKLLSSTNPTTLEDLQHENIQQHHPAAL